MKRLLLIGCLLGGFALLALGYWLGNAPVPPRPNVVFLLLDAYRGDRLGAERNGVPVAPFLSGLAKQSVYCPNAVSPCSWTRPVMASLFTSSYVDTHQVYYSEERGNNASTTSSRLPDDFETMAEYLTRHGYEAWAFQTNSNLHPALGFAQGYRPDHYLYDNKANAEQIVTKSLESVQSLREPFLLYAHFMEPHAPYVAPAAYRDRLGPRPALSAEDQSILQPDNQIPYLLDVDNVLMGVPPVHAFPPLSAAGQEEMKCLYDAELLYLDAQLDRLITAIRAAHPNTLFVVLADHGEEFWDHGGMGHGTTLYQEQIHVPLILSSPHLAARVIQEPVNTIDVLPGIAGFLGLPPNPAWQGKDLLGSPSQPAFSRTLGDVVDWQVDLESVVKGSMKLIRDKAHQRAMLFDLSSDFAETKNLAESQPDVVRGLAALLDAHGADNIRRRGSIKAQSVVLPPELIEQMKRDGYGKKDPPAK